MIYANVYLKKCVFCNFNPVFGKIQFSVFTFPFSPLSLAQTAISAKNIAWVFWVNRVFGVFLIYPKYPKYYLFFFFSIQTTNPHNRFFFIRLCGFSLSPNNLIASTPRTFCKGLSSLIYSVRGRRYNSIICVLPQGDIRRDGGCQPLKGADDQTYGAWHGRL